MSEHKLDKPLYSILIVVPVYNEADILEKNTKKIKKAVEKITKNYELILAEDGSTDGTCELAKKLSEKYMNVHHIHFEERQGKGRHWQMHLKNQKEIFWFSWT
ncbi:MAG: hypothetical protein DRN66_00375 [Candidatus Nanohalarchaeota archaeon]|nr:MAG: hypothetical protein DRN66_00375 [Candidatus Nanohaloarchaeota archaeon]